MEPPLGHQGFESPSPSSGERGGPARPRLTGPGEATASPPAGGLAGWGRNRKRSETMAGLETAVVIAVGAGLLLAARRRLERIVVYEYQRGVLYRRGRRIRTLEAGVYWLVRGVSSVVTVDV